MQNRIIIPIQTKMLNKAIIYSSIIFDIMSKALNTNHKLKCNNNGNWESK